MSQTPFVFPADYPSDVELLLRAKRSFDLGPRRFICNYLRETEIDELYARVSPYPDMLPPAEQHRMYPYIKLIQAAIHGALSVETYLFPWKNPLTSLQEQACLEFREDLWKKLFDHAEAQE